MGILGDQHFFDETRRSLLPPRPRALPIEYGYSVLNGRGLSSIDRFDVPPVLTVTLFATHDEETPIVFDVDHAYPWEASDKESADILRTMLSLHLTSPVSLRCSDRVVIKEHRRMTRKKMAFALLAGWSNNYPSIEPQAVTLTFNKRIGVRRTLAAFTNSVQQMVIGEVDRMFPCDTGANDCSSDIIGFPRNCMATADLSVPMI